MAYTLSDIFIGDFVMTQGFGGNPQAYAKFGLKGHNGQDWGVPTGTQIVATADGKVTETVYDVNGYGRYVKVVHNGFLTVYAHLQEWKVSVGQQVVRGQLIGISDNTGNSTGPHLHFGVAPCDGNGMKTETSNGYSGYIDPNGARCQWDIKDLTSPVVPGGSPPVGDQDKKDIASMKALRTYNGVWYTDKEVIADYEKVRAEVNKLNGVVNDKDKQMAEYKKKVFDAVKKLNGEI